MQSASNDMRHQDHPLLPVTLRLSDSAIDATENACKVEGTVEEACERERRVPASLAHVIQLCGVRQIVPPSRLSFLARVQSVRMAQRLHQGKPSVQDEEG